MKRHLLNLPKFESYLKEQGKSKNTISSYLMAVKKYVRWFQDKYNKLPERLFLENVLDYKEHLITEKMSPSSIYVYVAGLKSWNEFLIATGVQSEMVIQKADKKRIEQAFTSRAVHTTEDIQRFIQTVLAGNNKRDYALVNLLAYTGLRISEALHLTFEDIHLEAREMVVRGRKGEKPRTIFLSDRVVQILCEYLEQDRLKNRLLDASTYLFPSNRGHILSRVIIDKAFDSYSKKAGIHPAIMPHDLCNFFCSNELEKGLMSISRFKNSTPPIK